MPGNGFAAIVLGVVAAVVTASAPPSQAEVRPTATTAPTSTGNPVVQPLSGVVTASSQSGSHAAAYARGASDAMEWCARRADTTEWLQLDLGGLRALCRVDQTFAASDVWRFRILGSVDGQRWATLADESRGTADQTN